MQLYASQYPDEVAGVVLVEATHREQTIRNSKLMTKEQAAIIQDLTGNPEKVTFENFQESQDQVRAAIKFPSVPLIVLTKGLPTPKPSNWSASLGDPFPDLDKSWNEMQAEMVTLSPKGKQLIAEKSDHFIPDKQPEIIIQSIQEIINQV
jgi:pimeloyl-ACP methyl ester carboxylesterase